MLIITITSVKTVIFAQINSFLWFHIRDTFKFLLIVVTKFYTLIIHFFFLWILFYLFYIKYFINYISRLNELCRIFFKFYKDYTGCVPKVMKYIFCRVYTGRDMFVSVGLGIGHSRLHNTPTISLFPASVASESLI